MPSEREGAVVARTVILFARSVVIDEAAGVRAYYIVGLDCPFAGAPQIDGPNRRPRGFVPGINAAGNDRKLSR